MLGLAWVGFDRALGWGGVSAPLSAPQPAVIFFYCGESDQLQAWGLRLPVIPEVLWGQHLRRFVPDEVAVQVALLLPGCHDAIGFVCQDAHVAAPGKLIHPGYSSPKHCPTIIEVPLIVCHKGSGKLPAFIRELLARYSKITWVNGSH